MSVERMLAFLILGQVALSVLLVVVMALISPINAHPDELLHVRAGEYFQQHWLPPPVAGPRTGPSYSEWGFSYLDEADIVYLVFGSAASVGQAFGVAAPYAMRLVQVGLYFALVAWVVARARAFISAPAFLVLTPQVWYVFSYVNADALPFLLSTGLIVELAWSESPIRRFLRGVTPRATAGVWIFGLLLGCLTLSKRNYLVSLVFLACLALWLRADIASWRRVIVPLTMAAAIVVPWSGYHGWVNDFKTAARIYEQAEQTAIPALKLSRATSPDSFFYVGLQSKGVPLAALFTHLNWGGISFRSFTGVYGWMRIVGPAWFYQLAGLLGAALLCVLAVPAFRGDSRRMRILLGATVVFGALVIGQSVYRSWTLHFQAQGRYLFPVLPMLFFYWWQCEDPRFRGIVLFLAASLGMLGLYSFVFIGVPGVTPL